MKQIKLLGVLAIALTLGLSACNNANDNSNGGESQAGQVSECEKHTWGPKETIKEPTCTEDGQTQRTCTVCGAKEEPKTVKAGHKFGEWETVKAATCEEEGKQERTCSVCGAKEEKALAKTDHNYVADTSKTNVPATCTEAGTNYLKCSVCGNESTESVPANGHTWADAADQTGAVAPTCTEAGTKIQECSVCHATQNIAVEALGHDFPAEGRELDIPDATEKNTKGEIPFHWAKITNYSCSRGDSYRYAWSAKEVNFDYKTVADGEEPELLDDGDGIRFWGRPIGNAMVLSSDGRASSNDDEKIPDESVKGSRFEFDFVFDTDVNDVCLSADLTPAQYTNDIFKNRSGDQEWTPGYRFVDDDNDPATPKVPEQITGMRFIIYLDGVEVPLDASVNTAPNGRRWYQFPCKLNLTAGKHNLNIAMAGGYLHTFYSFSFEKVAPAHKHNFATETKVDKKGEGYVDYYTATCAKEGAQQIRVSAKDGTWTVGGNKSGTREGYIKPNANGDIISYKFDWAGQAVKAKLYQFGFMDGWSSNSGRKYTSIQNGQSVGPTGCNFGMKFNTIEVEIDAVAKDTPFSELLADATVDAGSSNSKAGACLVGEVNLLVGDNTFEFQRYASYNLAISDFLLVIEA